MPQPDDRKFSGNFRPIPMECDAYSLPVRGKLPRELNGSLYRNGPNPQFESPGSHWFVGDGMLHAFTIENGKASYRNRWVRTPKWLAERDAGRALFAGFGALRPDAPPTTQRDGGSANTHVVWHGGRLLALEEGHLPTEVEPRSLTTRGYCDYGGAIAGPAGSTGLAGVPARKLCHQRRLGVRLGDRRFRGSGDGICAWRSAGPTLSCSSRRWPAPCASPNATQCACEASSRRGRRPDG